MCVRVFISFWKTKACLLFCYKKFSVNLTGEVNTTKISPNWNLGKDFEAVLECSDTVSYFCSESSTVLEIFHFQIELEVISDKRKQASWWKDNTEKCDKSELLDKLHVMINDTWRYICHIAISHCLISSDAFLFWNVIKLRRFIYLFISFYSICKFLLQRLQLFTDR